MALFDGKDKAGSVDNEVLQKLSAVPLLPVLIEQITQDENEPWLWSSQSYYDLCVRTITVEPDNFEITWYQFDLAADPGCLEKEILGHVSLKYTDIGYYPLHSYTSADGKKTVPVERVCYLWTTVVRERLAEAMPNCRFDAIKGQKTRFEFSYHVEKPVLQDWF